MVVVRSLVEVLMPPLDAVSSNGEIAALLAGGLPMWACAWVDGVSFEVGVPPPTKGWVLES